MTALAVFLCIFCQLCMLGSQLLFKRAMNPLRPQTIGKTIAFLFFGIALQTAWFFIWTRLLSEWNLSQIFPFEGLNPAILALLAWVILKDRPTLQTWIGLLMIGAGIALSASN